MRNLVGAIVISGVCVLVLLLPLALISRGTYDSDLCLDVFAEMRERFAPPISCLRDNCPDQSLLSSPSPCTSDCFGRVNFDAFLGQFHYSPELVVACRGRGPSREMSELLEIIICAVYFKELPLLISDPSTVSMPITLSVVADFAGRVFRDCQWDHVTPQMCRFLDQLIESVCPSHHRCVDLETLRLERCSQKD